MKRYSEVIRLPTFEARFEYLRLKGCVGESTFGFDRYLNQALYRSSEWRSFRRRVLIRDNGCDLAFPNRDILSGRAIIHHLNPITEKDIVERNACLFDLDNAITVSFETHQAIHYGDASLLPRAPAERRPGDTKLW